LSGQGGTSCGLTGTAIGKASAGTLHVLGRSTHRSLPVSHPPLDFV
jgi:hypothetical protein